MQPLSDAGRTIPQTQRNSFYLRDATLARVLATALCLAVSGCLSVASRSSVKSGFDRERLLSDSPTLCVKEIQISTKIRVLPSGTFS